MVTVSGDSMFPVLVATDILFVMKNEKYIIGDILVYIYNNEKLVHRLLAMDDKYFYCKGDNSFRLETITKEQIIGKAVFIKRGNGVLKIPNVHKNFISMSLKVYREFCLNDFDHQKTLETDLFKKYKKLYLDQGD